MKSSMFSARSRVRLGGGAGHIHRPGGGEHVVKASFLVQEARDGAYSRQAIAVTS